MKFWGVMFDADTAVHSEWRTPGGDDGLDGAPLWMMLQAPPTTWIPFEQTSAALLVGRVWGMKSIGLSVRLAIMARATVAQQRLPEGSPERRLAAYEHGALLREFSFVRGFEEFVANGSEIR